MVAAMNGVIITASTTAAVKMLESPGAEPNRPDAVREAGPTLRPSQGLSVLPIAGASTKKPHMP